MRWKTTCLVSVAVVALGFSVTRATANHGDPTECVSRFVEALNRGDAAGVRAECASGLWTRLEPDLQGQAPPGRFEVVGGTIGRVRADLGRGYLLWTHPDGVQDLLDVTVIQSGDCWKVSGGFGGATPARPLADR